MITPDAGQNIITRGLPKTGQTILYRAGDDGQYEAGWWKGRLNANNRNRWIAETIWGDDIVRDRATGLMWPTDGLAAGCLLNLSVPWNNAIDQANASTFAGFSDWRLPNAFELVSILYFSGAGAFIEQPPFINTAFAYYWTSTTDRIQTTRAFLVSFSAAVLTRLPKTDIHKVRFVRKGI